MIRIRINFPEISYVKYSLIPSPIYKYRINLVVSLSIRRCPGGCATISFTKRTVLLKLSGLTLNFFKEFSKSEGVVIILGHWHANVL